MSLKYEPVSEPLHMSVPQTNGNDNEFLNTLKSMSLKYAPSSEPLHISEVVVFPQTNENDNEFLNTLSTA